MINFYPLRPLEREPPDDLPDEPLLLLLLLEDLALEDLDELELRPIDEDRDDLLLELPLAVVLPRDLEELLLDTPLLVPRLVPLDLLVAVERPRLTPLVPLPTLRLVVFLFPTEFLPRELVRPFLP